MPKESANSYDRLLKQMNRKTERAARGQCECGKEVFLKQLDKHRQTTIHHVLMFKKNKATQPKI